MKGQKMLRDLIESAPVPTPAHRRKTTLAQAGEESPFGLKDMPAKDLDHLRGCVKPLRTLRGAGGSNPKTKREKHCACRRGGGGRRGVPASPGLMALMPTAESAWR